MKKNIVLFLAVVFVFAVCITTTFGLTGCSKNNPTSEPTQSSTQKPEHSDNTEKSDSATDSTDEASENIGSLLFNTLSVNKDKVYGKVSNETDAFSFINEIKTEGLTKYIVSLDIYGSQQVATKTIPLNEGDNIVYIIEMLNNEPQAIYEVTIRRRLIYKVSFYTNNEIRISDQQVEEDSCATMPNSPEKRGYTFDKWNYDFSTPITKDTIIDAKWNIITYNISYNLNGGILDGKNPTTYTVEDEITLINPTKRGYNANWDNGGKISKGSIGDKTFNANWTAIVYKISYNLNGGTINGENPTTYTVEDEITLTNTPTKQGYNFANWDNGGKIAKGSIGDKIFNASYNTPIVYKINYNLNGGTIDGENPTTYTVEDEITLINPTKCGYNANWDNGGKISKGSIGDKTFSAMYTPIVYKITYNCGKGANNMLNPLEYTIESETIILNGAYYINADFIEWQQNDVKTTEIANGSIGDVTLTAVWDEYDVKLQENGDCYTVIGLNTNKTDIEIKPSYKGKKVTSITDNALKNCSQITSITIPDSVNSIGCGAFNGCSSLESITLPFVGASRTASNAYEQVFGYIFGYTTTSSMSSVSGATYQVDKYDSKSGSIEYYHYYIPSGIKTVVLSNNVTSIGTYAFRGCRELTSITIPDSVTSIGRGAFEGCWSLESIILPFIGASKTASNGYDQVFGYIFGCTASLNMVSISGATYQYSKYHSNSDWYEYFYYYIPSSLKTVVLSNIVTSIGSSAFYNCSGLTSVTIGNSVTSIGGEAFKGCTCLTNITVDTNNKSFTSIDGNLYSKNKAKLIQYAIGKTDTSFTIPEGVIYINDNAFNGCISLTSVTIPDSVTFIDYGAFQGCNKLKTVYYKGNAEQWDKISIYGSNNYLTSATRYYYSENEPALNSDGAAYDGNYWHYDSDGITPVIWKKEN